MAARAITSGAAAVARGEAEIGLQQVSEVLAIPGTHFVGAIPPQVQYETTYAAAVVAGSTNVPAARRLIEFRSAEGAAVVIARSGMEPAGRE